MDIKKIVDAAVANGAVVTTDARIVNVSIAAEKQETGVGYWCTLTLDKEVDGMYAVGRGVDAEWKRGKTRTVTVPVGTVQTLVYQALTEKAAESDDAYDLLAMRKLVAVDAAAEAKSAAADVPHVSALHHLLLLTKVNIIAREVKVEDKTVKALFSLNESEHEVKRDSVWHDLYNLQGISERGMQRALAVLEQVKTNAAANTAASATNTLQAMLAKYAASTQPQQNSVNAVLA